MQQEGCFLGPVLAKLMLFFICQTLISKIASRVKLFISSSHEDMSWDEAEKSSLSQLSPLFLSPPCMKVLVKLFCQTVFPKQLSFT
jgi:hypothetical protein